MDQKVVIILVVVGIFICCISAVLSIGGVYYFTKEDEDDIIGSGSGGSAPAPTQQQQAPAPVPTQQARAPAPTQQAPTQQAPAQEAPAPAPAQEAPAPVQERREPGGLRIQVQADTNLCLKADSKSKGAQLNFKPCDRFDELQRFDVMGDNQNGIIRLTGTGVCIDAKGGDWDKHSHLWDCNANNGNQKYKREFNAFKLNNSNKHLHSHYGKAVHLDFIKNDGANVAWQRFNII